MARLKRMTAWAGVAFLATAAPAWAQIGPIQTPALPGLPGGVADRLPALDDVERLARPTVRRVLEAPARLRELIRRSGGALERDPSGWPVVTGEVLAMDLSDAARAQAQGIGFILLREERMEALDLTITVLAPPPRMSLARAAERLRRIDPAAEITFNHIHAPAGVAEAATVRRGPTSTVQASEGSATGARLGLIDTGVDATHPALAGSRIIQRGFAGPSRTSPHGLAVASLMIGRSGPFSGGAPGATLLAADIYGGQAAGGSSTALAQALAWMVEQRAAVVNVSLVGPRNALVERAVARARARGVMIVAAVGNDGPAAPALYPAAYDGVIGVTAVNGRNRVLPEAGRGAQVDFAAPGADMAAAAQGGGWTSVRGTSFAAPIVAGLLARRGVAALEREAIDLGARGPDPVYGAGLVGVASRVAPRDMGARGRLAR
ncbi:S8 family serine peptidase [Brevundimonas sp. NPDC055814]